MQTSLLESQPEAHVSFGLGGELLRVTEDAEQPVQATDSINDHCLLLQRPPGNQDWSFVACVHPTDFLSLTCEQGARGCKATFALFPDSLEKGVIRRARIRGIFVPRAGDLDYARQCGREMVQAAPPLTT